VESSFSVNVERLKGSVYLRIQMPGCLSKDSFPLQIDVKNLRKKGGLNF
jgi:hypothetical protein